MLIGIRSDCVTGAETLEEKMTILKSIGCDFVELVVNPEMLGQLTGSEFEEKYFPKQALRELNRISVETGMPIKSVSYGGMFEYAVKPDGERAACRRELRQCIELSSALGADTILIATCELQTEFKEAAQKYKTELQPELDFALSRNVRLCFEPVARGNKNANVVMLVQTINHAAAYTYFDMGNCIHFGEDPVAALADCAEFVGALHIKPGRDMLLGEMPLAGILNILDNAGFDGVGVLEMNGGDGNKVLSSALETLDTVGYRE